MSSSYKFPKGLNNWIGADKPTREDFVSDNEIIDKHVMWKENYDADGQILDSGGISAYAMHKAAYDPAGVIADAGGIAEAIDAAVSANEGFSTYLHDKNGAAHSLTNENGSDILKFIATAAFDSDDTFSVNGTVCTTVTTDGEPLSDNCFVAGSVVSCFKNGTQLVFAGGGYMPKTGGAFAGAVSVPNTNSAALQLRNILVQDSAGNAVSTGYIIGRRK